MNRQRTWAAGAAAALALTAGGFGLYRLGQHSAMGGMPPASAASAPAGASGAVPQSMAEGEEATRRHLAAGVQAGDVDPANGRKVLYYHDPMVPGQRFDKPGKSPFMDMMLVPVYANGDADPSTVVVSPRMQQSLGVRTAEVVRATLAPGLSAVGSIAFNEREQAVIQARASGFVERLHVRATLDRVRQGQPLAELYVPDWVAAQQEFLSVRRLQGPDVGPLVEGARSRMRLAGMTEPQIRAVEASGQVRPHTTVVAPVAGLVTELAAREGMAVMPGATLFRINGFATVWAQAEVPESQAALLRPGAPVRAQAAATPGVTYEGRVQALVPDVDASTRTIKARVELANPNGLLVPGLFVSMQFGGLPSRQSLVVPSEAVIATGRRSVVIVAEEQGRFRAVQVQTGMETGGQTEITQGLQAGQRVVVSSQFLIDSEASLKGFEARLNNEPSAPVAPAAPAAPQRHQGEARVEAVGKEEVTLSHGPIPSIRWGPMTMDFKLPPPGQRPAQLRPGDSVHFEFQMDSEGLPQLTRVSPLGSAPASRPADPASGPGGKARP